MKGSIVEDIEEKRRIPVKVLWALVAGTVVLLLLWLTGVLDREAGEPQPAGEPNVSALHPEIHALRPAIVKLKPLIEKDPNLSSESDEE